MGLKDFYTVKEKLGCGGFGSVFAGFRNSDSKPVAIKNIKKDEIDAWKTIKNITIPMEIYLLEKVRYIEGVVTLLDWYEESDSFHIIMERLPSISLFDYQTEKRCFSEEETRNFFNQIVRTLSKIHSVGVIHHDLTTENILIDTTNQKVNIIDFGLASLDNGEPIYEFMSGHWFTPPEFIINGCYNGHSATVWCLGVMLYDLLVGNMPFEFNEEICKGQPEFPDGMSEGEFHSN